MMIEVTPEYIMTLMDIRNGTIEAPEDVRKEVEERLKMLDDFFAEEAAQTTMDGGVE